MSCYCLCSTLMVNSFSTKIHISKAIKTDLDLQNWFGHFGFEEKSVLLCILILCQEAVMRVESLPGESILSRTTHTDTHSFVSLHAVWLCCIFSEPSWGEGTFVHFLFGAYLLVLQWPFLNPYHQPAKVCACVSECSSFPFPLEHCFLADIFVCAACVYL